MSSTVRFIGGPVDGDVRTVPDDVGQHIDVATLPPVFVWDTEAEQTTLDVTVTRHRYERRGFDRFYYAGVL